MSFESSITVANDGDEKVTLHLEPWGEQLTMPPSTKFRVIAIAEMPGEFEIGLNEGNIFVWAWSTARVRVFTGDAEVSSAATQVPTPNMS